MSKVMAYDFDRRTMVEVMTHVGGNTIDQADMRFPRVHDKVDIMHRDTAESQAFPDTVDRKRCPCRLDPKISFFHAHRDQLAVAHERGRGVVLSGIGASVHAENDHGDSGLKSDLCPSPS
jgi:hypothetical protein